MRDLRPDTTGLEAIRNQPEFNQQLWQYLNRAVSDWKVAAGKEKAKEYAALFFRIEHDFGVEPSFMLGVWGIESAFGDPIVAKNHMRPVIPSLATLAWAEPRRHAYWQSELINALTIVQHGWSTPEEMVGSWAGAMGHTQWMPEVWLHLGIDYNGDGKISPYGPPDDALATTARFFVERGHYRRGEHWGYEVRMPPSIRGNRSRSYAAWQALGVSRADGKPLSAAECQCAALDSGSGRPRLSARSEFLCRTRLQSVDELCPRTCLSRRSLRRRRTIGAKLSRRRAGPNARRGGRDSTAADCAWVRHWRRRRSYRQQHDDRRAQLSAQDRYGPGRRLSRPGPTRPVAPRLVIRLDVAAKLLRLQYKECLL
jgi:lytic murein transglycosylase